MAGFLIPMNFAGRGGWSRHQGKVDGPGRGTPAGRHPRRNNRGPVWGDSVDTYGCPGAHGPGQEGSGRVRSWARARWNWVSQGQPRRRCKVSLRAERVRRPAREKNLRRRVLVVTSCSPRAMWAAQRARLWAMTWTDSQAALAAKRPQGR